MQEDPQYLKNFVKEHPDNKMGWYLLGRHYDEIGQTEKSLFCYAKAGEIFEAFEHKKLPVGIKEAAKQVQLVQDANQIKGDADPVEEAVIRTKSLKNKTTHPYPLVNNNQRRNKLRLIAILLLLLAGIIYSPASEDQDLKQVNDSLQTQSSEPTPKVVPNLIEEQNGGELAQQQLQRVVFVAAGSGTELLQKAAGAVALSTAHESSSTVLAQGYSSSDNKWTAWTKEPRILFSVEDGGQSGKVTLQQYDKEACGCEPADDTAVASVVREWQFKQEQEILLRSAISAYQHKNNAMPTSLEDLTGNYPNNIISGITQEMIEEWETLHKGEAAQKPTDPAVTGTEPDSGAEKAGGGAKQSLGSLAGSGSSPTESPLASVLEIIVDQQKHRLAIVSGKVILRSYPVGLGGERTPEGNYVVTEKVKNPNGKTTGPFGSRGMTLSDTLYAIHGTNDPDSMDKDLSQGCVRMLQGDLEELYDMTPLGTKVTIGRGLLPEEIYRAKNRLHLPAKTDETNPAKVYSWLD
ncbi:MAG: L,D-transpeptidase family protein [Gorillibacterium sp.]|nr:L,D-transpeptidase family protein [Gorillibacterium sp.]